MYPQQVSPVPASVAADLETLCATLDLLQAGAQADLNALAGCLTRLAGWLKNRQKGAPDDSSDWKSESFGVKDMGGMVTCHSDRWKVIFNQDGSRRPYLGMWQSRLPGETGRSGSFQIQVADGGVQLLLEGARSLRVSLAGFEAAAWGAMDAFYQELNSRHQSDAPQEETPPRKLPVLPTAPNPPQAAPSPHANLTILAQPPGHQIPPGPLASKNPARKPASGKQPAMIDPKTWDCVCGRQNTGAFCPQCGSKQPAQPAVCRQCGGVLSIGARFCRNCGAEVRG
ncbi:MAG: hypothetical protein VB089_11675 [Anaerolineaceae bacterium]|nr:hypothetical protein [Anaerolineaceae bacterium]